MMSQTYTPVIDIELFEEQILYRPMAGKWYEMMPVEIIECLDRYTFCNSSDQITLYNDQTDASFFYKKSINLVYQELKHLKNKYEVEYNYFWAHAFLSLEQSRV
jgi:hypothetical protein